MCTCRSQPYTESTLKEALSLQESMTADMGGTEIFKPLESVFKNKSSDSYARQVHVLSYIYTNVYVQLIIMKYQFSLIYWYIDYLT